jgi:magnesium chelatase family protein
MSLALVHTRAIAGLVASPVRVEADLANGLPSFSIVGLPDAAVREARDRVRAAIANSGFEFPQRRVTINLAPADLPKDSGRFDLPIALGILAASGQIPAEPFSRWEFVGELSLTGDLLPVRAAFALAVSTLPEQADSNRSLLLPQHNQAEATLTGSDRLGFAAHLSQVVSFLKTGQGLAAPLTAESELELDTASARHTKNALAGDWQDIKGQEQAKRAAEIAAAGRHNLMMFGSPGVGKSMIASRMPGLLPPLTQQQACELASIRSLDQGVDTMNWRSPPYRAPHHTTPSRALIGGGQPVKPGEISLAHHGVLFLDELAEFSRDTLESLREPLETAEVSVARVKERIKFPADVMLVAAMNPCPCGYFGVRHPQRVCRCPPERIERYRSKISGPLMDRFDLAVSLSAQSVGQMMGQAMKKTTQAEGDTSPMVADRVAHAHHRQISRQGMSNARLSGTRLDQSVQLDAESWKILRQSADRWGWSARAWHRVLRVSRTIADLERSEKVNFAHLGEAIELRRAIDLPPAA